MRSLLLRFDWLYNIAYLSGSYIMTNENESSKILTIEDQVDFVPRGLRIRLDQKLSLARIAGYRQYNKDFGKDFSSFPVTQLITEALADEFNLILEKPKATKHMQLRRGEMKGISYNMPEKFDALLEEKKKIEGISVNEIYVRAIDKKIAQYAAILEDSEESDTTSDEASNVEKKTRPTPRKF